MSYSSVHSVLSLEYPRIIWTYWEGQLTPFVRSFIANTTRIVGSSWKVNFLTPSNVSNYVKPSEIPKNIMLCYPQLKANFIRLKLLEKYGGWWMDGSTLIASLEYFEGRYTAALSSGADFLGYCGGRCHNNRWIENGMMYAPKNSLMIHYWVKEMERMFHLGIRNYIFSIYREGLDITTLIFTNGKFKYPSPKTYFISFVCAQVVQNTLIPRKTPIITDNIYKTLFKLEYECRTNKACFDKAFQSSELAKKYPIIKLTRDGRKIADPDYHPTDKQLYDFHPLDAGIKLGILQNLLAITLTLLHLTACLLFLRLLYLSSIFFPYEDKQK